MHYCKGILESVSVFISAGCNEHEQGVVTTSCCTSEKSKSCTTEGIGCCEDEAAILLQDFDSPVHHVDKWENHNPAPKTIAFPSLDESAPSYLTDLVRSGSDTGPPIYILFGSLIFYA